MDKFVNINKVYKIIDKVISGIPITEDDRFELYRFRDKLTDSENFELSTNRVFSAIQLTKVKDQIENLLSIRSPIQLKCGFILRPVDRVNWELYKDEKMYLNDLDTKTASKIALDINVAIRIKCSRDSKLK